MFKNSANQEMIGRRIRLIRMTDDPDPIEPGTIGIIYNVGLDVYNVKWDNGRNLGVVEGVDQFEILPLEKGNV
jgi:hypothetical protein